MTATGKSLLAQRTIKKVRVLQEALYRAAKENPRRRVVWVSAGAWLSRRDCGDSEVGDLWLPTCNRRRHRRVLRFDRPSAIARTGAAARPRQMGAAPNPLVAEGGHHGSGPGANAGARNSPGRGALAAFGCDGSIFAAASRAIAGQHTAQPRQSYCLGNAAAFASWIRDARARDAIVL